MSEYIMHVEKVEEAGYEAALRGLAHNKKRNLDDMKSVAEKLASHDGGHNKFLESIIVWLDVQAPRYWWQEADTFRLSTKQSESTMHTLMGELASVDMDDSIAVSTFLDENFETQSCSTDVLKRIQMAVASGNIVDVKKLLPEGFLQKRLWCMSYRTLRNIIGQRRTHRLPHWQSFIKQVLKQIEHPELLPELKRHKND